MKSEIKVLKFGSSVLRGENDLPKVVHEIYRHWRQGSQVLVVVSALGKTTDELLQRAKDLCGEPHPYSLAALLATGEATSAALLGLAVHRAGIPVKVLSPEQIGLKTAGETLDAEPLEVNVRKLQKEVENKVVIVSGFVGIGTEGDLTLLGRGGSDFTALFLAENLNADCILYKDVDGLYESNPNENVFRPRRFTFANWRTVNAVGDGLVQPKAVRFAEKHGLSFSITSIGANVKTRVCKGDDELALPESENAPLKVALLGCGTVGGGVYRRLAELPKLFEVVGVADRNIEKALAAGVSPHLITADATELIEKDCDLVIELFGGIKPTRSFITKALNLKRHVITANKALLANDEGNLESLAERCGVSLSFSAAVGGVMPALEAVSQAKNLHSFAGIVNGTCNFICDELAAGKDFAESVQAAQKAGFAEADPELDLSGADAAQKLVLLAQAAFDINLSFDSIEREGIKNLDAAQVQKASEKGKVIRLVAECRQTKSGEIEASVKPSELPASHPFAQIKGAENCLSLKNGEGEVKYIYGRGAGRWATTEAVIADLFDVRREVLSAKTQKAVAAKFYRAEVFV